MGIGEGVEGCYKCMKYTLVAFNFIVLVIGGAVLGLGVYTLVSDYGVSEMTDILGSDLYKAGTYMLIATGAVTVVISFFGCCGACMESRCLLGLYFAVMLILTILFIAVCVVGFVFKNNISGHLRREAETILINKYGKDEDVTRQWDKMQKDLKCCGVYGGPSSNTSWAIYKLESHWFQDQNDTVGYGKKYVPFSCCNLDEDKIVCAHGNASAMAPKHGPPVTGLIENPGLYTEGCYDELDNFLNDNALIIGGIALAALFIMVIGVIFSICLCVQIGRQGYVV